LHCVRLMSRLSFCETFRTTITISPSNKSIFLVGPQPAAFMISVGLTGPSPPTAHSPARGCRWQHREHVLRSCLKFACAARRNVQNGVTKRQRKAGLPCHGVGKLEGSVRSSFCSSLGPLQGCRDQLTVWASHGRGNHAGASAGIAHVLDSTCTATSYRGWKSSCKLTIG